MTEPWHKTATSEDTEAFSISFWQNHRQDLESGEFWADRIKKLRDNPIQRLQLAIENLPLPAAFREAAIAIRALIRQCRKDKEPYDEQLSLLYWLAAISSFEIPYSEILREPGYNVVASVPGEVLKKLSYSYKQLGYEKLSLLNKTDKKWLIENWGQPESHMTLHELHHDVWTYYEQKLSKKRKGERQVLAAELHAIGAKHRTSFLERDQAALPNPPTESNPQGLSIGTAFMTGLIVLTILFWLLP